MKKNYFLVAVTIPERTKPERWQAWLGFQQERAPRSTTTGGSERLAENVWLIPRDNGVSLLASLVHDAEQFQLPCKVRFLTEESCQVAEGEQS